MFRNFGYDSVFPKKIKQDSVIKLYSDMLVFRSQYYVNVKARNTNGRNRVRESEPRSSRINEMGTLFSSPKPGPTGEEGPTLRPTWPIYSRACVCVWRQSRSECKQKKAQFAPREIHIRTPRWHSDGLLRAAFIYLGQGSSFLREAFYAVFFSSQIHTILRKKKL